MKLAFSSDPAGLSGVRAGVRDFLEELPFDEGERYLLLTGIEEACTNIIRHAYGGRPDRTIRIELAVDEAVFECRLRDYGRPAEVGKFAVRVPHSNGRGGMGYHLMHRAFDEVHYLPCKRGTQLVMRRRLFAEEEGRRVC